MTSRKLLRALLLILFSTSILRAQGPVGIFENHSDVGTVLHAGTAAYDSDKKTYTLTGSGENMWATHDEFQFAWKKVSGDVQLTADVSFANTSGNEHKKAVLIFRQSLDTDSVYVDVALHASGLTSLQYRDEKGANTQEERSAVTNQVKVVPVDRTPSEPEYKVPFGTVLTLAHLRLTRRGNYVYLSVGNPA